MGNVQGWAGPLTQHWHSIQTALQKQILKQMRNFGMLPILPAFAGHVPRGITKIFPNASVSHSSNWGNFNSTYCWYITF